MSEDIASRPQIRISVTKRRQNSGSTSGATTRSASTTPKPVQKPASGARAADHLGVGTKRPVGRKSRVRISATNDTMTAWAGLTQSEA